ncbi:MAG: segregation/condensation protein A [Elusimicrobiota bacterium]|nr:segregation/condensation protein A [Elusimicrobiota bacterium]
MPKESATMPLDIHLEIFEGPLDLLLFLIRKNDLNIYDIPISQITAEYLEYLELMKELNLDIASEFLVMAATLMQIKSRTLLPQETVEEEGPDPRAELISKLLEYQKYKLAAEELSKRELSQQGIYYRSAPIFTDEDFFLEVSIFDLIDTFRTVLKQLPTEVKEIIYEEIPIESKIRQILSKLETAKTDKHNRKFINFTDLLMSETTRLSMIVLFLALLELIRLKQVIVRQSRPFGEIRIYLV